ncbi:MAG: uroporphyrinogen decarboxylase family protein [Fusicatenibacter sp.]|nr:methyltransferase [Fusicatenibacter sp.]
MTSKELVLQTLEFRNTSGRVPRQLWLLPWAQDHHNEMLQKLNQDFQWDFDGPAAALKEYPKTKGDPYGVGEYVDEWGCIFTNIQKGVIGEVKQPIVTDEDWADAGNVHIPEELLTFDIDQVNADCEKKQDKFLFSGCCPRPFEQLQFIRGTVDLYMDLMDPPKEMLEFIKKMHDYYCRLMTKWAKTDVDALNMMDDWGSQNDLLINPQIWDDIFKPMYKDYIDIAHSHGKKIFMHSDGHILRIIPRLIDLGLDAINSQIFCMGVENLKPFAGKITFWGEIDRQHLLPYGTKEDIDHAVSQVYQTLWNNGGCIAQCEFGPGANPENVYRVFEKWQEMR